jgi:chorismate mutase
MEDEPMSNGVDEIRARVRQAEAELESALDQLVARQRERFRYTVRAGRVRFESGMRALHRSRRKELIAYVRNAPLSFILTAPVIYSLIIPLVILDISITAFQHIAFRVFGIGRVRRDDYFVIDRHLLGYLNAIEKLNCVYCGYANGLLAYAREIAARTEQYWCPIKHATRAAATHDRAGAFFEYGDEDTYHTELRRIRAKLID